MRDTDDPRIVYTDIIDAEYHKPNDRNHMSLHDRAAQFAPFAALVGFDAMIEDEARQTEEIYKSC